MPSYDLVIQSPPVILLLYKKGFFLNTWFRFTRLVCWCARESNIVCKEYLPNKRATNFATNSTHDMPIIPYKFKQKTPLTLQVSWNNCSFLLISLMLSLLLFLLRLFTAFLRCFMLFFSITVFFKPLTR